MQFVLFLFKKLKDKNSFFSFSRTIVRYSVSFGTFLITSIIFVLAGFKHEIKKNIFDFSGNYRFCKYQKEPIDIADFTEKFSRVRGLKRISPFIKKNVLIQCKDSVEGALFFGVDVKNLNRYVVIGKLCENENEVVVGKKLFEKLRVNVGEEVVVLSLEEEGRYLKYRIVGVYETGIDEVDDKVSLCSLEGLQKINFDGKNLCDGVNLTFDGKYEKLRDVAKDYCGRLHSVEKDYVYVSDWLKILEKNSLMYVFIIFCTILTNVICILILQLFENKRLIDLLLSIGASVGQVGNIFVLRNMELVFRSMVGGSLFAFVLGFLQWRCRFIGLNASDYYLNFVPVYFDMKMFLLFFVVMLCVMMGVLRVVFSCIKKK